MSATALWFYTGAPWVTDTVRQRGREVSNAYARTNRLTPKEAWWVAAGYEDGAFAENAISGSSNSLTPPETDAYHLGYQAGEAERKTGPVHAAQLDLL